MADSVFGSGCGDGLGVNQMEAARDFVAEELRLVPAPLADPALVPEKAAPGWLASGSAAFVCDKGTVTVHVDTRAGSLADRAEVRCELRFMPADRDPWDVWRRATGVAVGRPQRSTSKSVHWDFMFDDGLTRRPIDEKVEVRPGGNGDMAAIAFVGNLGWA